MKSIAISLAISTIIVLFPIAALAQEGWQMQESGTVQNLYSISVTDENISTAVGNAATILRTTDAGQNWEAQVPEPASGLLGVSFADAQAGVATGYDGTILYTSNGGEDWQTIQTGWFLTYRGAFQLTPMIGWVVGSNSIFQPLAERTTDGWQTFDYAIFYLEHGGSNEGNLRDVCFIDDQIGCAVAAVWTGEGAVVRSADGGASWSTVAWIDHVLEGIDFESSTTGYAVGLQGGMLKSTDAGSTWNPLSSGVPADLYGVSFGAPGTGTAVGQIGVILRTTDGGETWSEQESGTGSNLNSVFFINADNGYIVGNDGIILHTTTGGEPVESCEYIAGDCNHNGIPLELSDIVSIIGLYRGTQPPFYTCDCPPNGTDFAPEADVNGNCVAFELGDVVTGIAAYRGTAEASGCEDCPPSF
jgi:photosystem II stability/assembly factor-like uncharacterized protein